MKEGFFLRLYNLESRSRIITTLFSKNNASSFKIPEMCFIKHSTSIIYF